MNVDVNGVKCIVVHKHDANWVKRCNLTTKLV